MPSFAGVSLVDHGLRRLQAMERNLRRALTLQYPRDHLPRLHPSLLEIGVKGRHRALQDFEGRGREHRHLALPRDLDQAGEPAVRRVAEELDGVHLLAAQRASGLADVGDGADRYGGHFQSRLSGGLRQPVLEVHRQLLLRTEQHADGAGLGHDPLDQRDPLGLLRITEARRVDAGHVGQVVVVLGARARREGIRQKVEDDGDGLDPLHRGLQRGILQRDDHLGAAIDCRVEQAGQGGQVALGAADPEIVVLTLLHVRLPEPQLDRILTPLAAHPVRRSDDRDQRSGSTSSGAGRVLVHPGVLGIRLPAAGGAQNQQES